MQRIGIIGGGAWGTALAVVAAKAGREVTIWAHEPEVVAAVNGRHENPVFLPDVALDPAITATADMARAARADLILLVVPAQFLRAACKSIAGDLAPKTPVVICAKGIEQGSGALMTDVVRETLPAAEMMILSGPTFAREVALGLPTAVTLGAGDAALGQKVAEAIGSPTFRPYLSNDVIGAEIGGAVKNVLAIGCGIADGRGLGANARAALLTRGLAEIVRLAVARGGRAETLMGLSGLGDLVLTATSMQSRNFSLGVALGKGQSLAEILGTRRSIAEGVASAGAVVGLAGRLGLDMPICTAVDAVLNHGGQIDAVLKSLLERPLRAEVDTPVKRG